MKDFNITKQQYEVFVQLKKMTEVLDKRTKKPFIYNGVKVYSKQLILMDIVAKNPQSNLVEIAQRATKTKGTIHLQLEHLIQMKMVEKKSNQQENKRTCFTLTEQGEHILTEHHEKSFKFLEYLKQNGFSFEDKETKQTINFLSLVNKWIEEDNI